MDLRFELQKEVERQFANKYRQMIREKNSLSIPGLVKLNYQTGKFQWLSSSNHGLLTVLDYGARLKYLHFVLNTSLSESIQRFLLFEVNAHNLQILHRLSDLVKRAEYALSKEDFCFFRKQLPKEIGSRYFTFLKTHETPVYSSLGLFLDKDRTVK